MLDHQQTRESDREKGSLVAGNRRRSPSGTTGFQKPYSQFKRTFVTTERLQQCHLMNELGAGVCVQLRRRVSQMELDRPLADEQCSGDLLIALALAHE